MTLTDIILLVLGYSLLTAVISVLAISYSLTRAQLADKHKDTATRDIQNSEY